MAAIIVDQPPRPRDQVRRNGRDPRTMAIRHTHRRPFKSISKYTITRRQAGEETPEDGERGPGRDQGDYEADHVECDVSANSRGRM